MKVIWTPWLLLATGCGAPTLEITLVDPGLICDEQAGATLRIGGSALEPAVQDALSDEPSLLMPTIVFELAAGATEASEPPAGRTVEVPLSRVRWTAPDAVEVDIDGGVGLEPGSWDVVVQTRTGSEARVEAGLTVLDPPQLAAVTPTRACHEAAAVELDLTGQGFLLLDDGTAPTVTVDAIEASVIGAYDCAALVGPTAGELCGGLTLELAPGTLALGEVALSLVNPAPAACSSALDLSLEVVLPPEIDDVEPEIVCSSGGTVTVTGGPFIDGTEVELGALPVTAVTVVDETTVEIEVAAGAPLGAVDLTLSDPSGCTTTLDDAFTVVNPPQAFHVDPPVVPSGRAVTVTARLADVNDTVTDAWLVHDDGEEREIDWSWSEDRASELQLELPADLATGRWQLGLSQANACAGILAAGVEVAAEATIAVEAVEPPHAWIFDHSSIDITASDPLPAGAVGFEEVPGVYLLGPEGIDRSEALLAVRYQDEHRITAVVPPELEPGSYDLLVVNPDGAYGVLADAVAVGWDAPPSIDSVAPATLEKASDVSIEIQGASFREPTVTLSCMEGGNTTELSAAVDSYGYGTIQASLSTRGFNQALCVVQVTNGDGTLANWSALSITNPAQNLFPFEDGPPMVEARRAPAGAAGRTSSTDRWVYAIGGDAGDEASASDSVEVAAVDPYGAMDSWALLPDPLPSALTQSAATTVGRFVYLAGGDDGGGPVSSVQRAMILDPLDVPWLDQVSLDSAEGDGLEAGRWTYRVSALFDSTHPSNPDGESLAGEPVSITLPASEHAWSPSICWEPVDDAVGYRVYRSVDADSPSSELGWLADASGDDCYQDLGDPVDTTTTPLPEGALGSWSTVAELNEARSGACLAMARDPALDPESYHLYVAGGLDDSGALLDSIERVEVTVESASVHSVATPEILGTALSEPRWQCRGYIVDDELHSVADGETWVVFAGGMTARNATGTVDSGVVLDGGELDAWDTLRSLSPARAGFAHASASDFLYAFGGQQGSPSTTSTSAELRNDGGLEIHNWNSLGDGLGTERALPGSAQESAVIFILGGQTDTQDATTSTECTHY